MFINGVTTESGNVTLRFGETKQFLITITTSTISYCGACCAASREVPGSIPGGVTGDFFRGTPDRTMCPEVESASESEYQGFLLG